MVIIIIDPNIGQPAYRNALQFIFIVDKVVSSLFLKLKPGREGQGLVLFRVLGLITYMYIMHIACLQPCYKI
jgi:hypothetical protein